MGLLGFHVDILSQRGEWIEDSLPSSDTEIWSAAYTMIRMDSAWKISGQEDFAGTHYKGWADVKWLCTVGLGCVCGEECREEI